MGRGALSSRSASQARDVVAVSVVVLSDGPFGLLRR